MGYFSHHTDKLKGGKISLAPQLDIQSIMAQLWQQGKAACSHLDRSRGRDGVRRLAKVLHAAKYFLQLDSAF